MSRLLLLLALVLPYLPAAPVPRVAPSGATVLDDCDAQLDGKTAYEDNLTFLSAAGKVRRRVGGLNVCQEVGSPHRIAVDPARGQVWVAETVGGRLLRYDLDGKLLSATPGVNGNAVAVESKTGRAWVVRSKSTGREDALRVFDPAGKLVAEHAVGGYDIAYDGRGKAFWLGGRELVKVALDGKVLFRRPFEGWGVVSVTVDARRGTVWAVSRQMHGRRGENRVFAFDGGGKEVASAGLETDPVKVDVDERDGSVWVAATHRAAVRLSADLSERATLAVELLTLAVEKTTGNVWVVTAEDVRKLDRGGKVLVRTANKAKTAQAWIASH